MSVTMPETGVAITHPTPCPPWCRDRHHPSRHTWGPTATWHISPQVHVANTDPRYPNDHTLLAAELTRCDEDGHTGETRMYVCGESDMDLNADETDLLIIQMQALVDSLRVLRRQMGPVR